jgi:hypothetical protein
MTRLRVSLLLFAALLHAGCSGSSVDGPEVVRVRNEAGPVEGNATLRFEATGGTGPVEAVPLTLRSGDLGEFRVNLTSDVRYKVVLVTGSGTLQSEEFVTGLGTWHVQVTVLADRIHVSTLHGD